MLSKEIRQAFLSFFEKRGHTYLPSSALIPSNDPTLLFTNAGMVPFKDVFLGIEKTDYTKATSSQRCVRAGGKHNDLENVGFTARHHTFFEMLGNFSFGDYFKREAIEMAWEFLTEELKLPSEKLWVTVFKDDKESEDIWLKEMKVDPKRFSRCGEADNFWMMGDVGPCGPCTEIFYDHGEDIEGGPPGSPEQEGDRYVEIWNLVFMQYNRDREGNLTPLPKPSVDTGMGLERIAAVMQGVQNNYDIDIFQHIIKAIKKMAKAKTFDVHASQVIADHIRSAAFLIVDGVVPSNEGRGYVLRRIIRRALRFASSLQLPEPFFYKLVKPLVEVMGDAFPELTEAQPRIEKVLKTEEAQFEKTLDQGLQILEKAMANLKGKEIPGDIVFKLYDTYGFPVDLTAVIAREHDLTIDEVGFNACMHKQKSSSKKAGKFKADYDQHLPTKQSTTFLGYKTEQAKANVAEMYVDGKALDTLAAGTSAVVILNETPFYPEGGGQVGDMGQLKASSGVFKVIDTQKQGDAILHLGQCTEGEFKKGESVEAIVDGECRQATRLNHTATHLLHEALRQVLGSHVVQKGSLVAPDRLRFDFTHQAPVTFEELQQIETMVNREIRLNHDAQTEEMSLAKAKKCGAMALFGEKYASDVRVLTLGAFSKEICGGTHVSRTGDIGLFKFTSESGVASGIRRVEAVTGDAAIALMQAQDACQRDLCQRLKVKPEALTEKVEQLSSKLQQQEKQLSQLASKAASARGSELLNQAVNVKGIPLLAVNVGEMDMKGLSHVMDECKSKLKGAVIALASVDNGKIHLMISVDKALSKQLPAGDIMKHLAAGVDGKGGGRPDLARGSGIAVDKLDGALASIKEIIAKG